MPPTQHLPEYLAQLSDDRIEPMHRLMVAIREHLPSGFQETIKHGMIGWVVPLERYPSGYHVNPKVPLPFLNLASQKSHIGLYHMGLYANPSLRDWFVNAYPDHCKTKLNMGKSCIRFTSMKSIPYDLVGELCSKMTVDQWISVYEKQRKQPN